MSIKIEKYSLYLIYNIVSFSKMAGKVEFSGEISWIWNSSQISRKVSYWENLLLFWNMYNKASAHLYTLRNNICTIKNNSPTNNHLMIVNNSYTRKRCEICSTLTIKTPECCSTIFIVNFEHISHFFLLFLLFTLNK